MLKRNNLQQFSTFTIKQHQLRYYLPAFGFIKERETVFIHGLTFITKTLQAVMEYHNCFFYYLWGGRHEKDQNLPLGT